MTKTKYPHKLLRMTNQQARCEYCDVMWRGEDDVHPILSDPIDPNDIEDGWMACWRHPDRPWAITKGKNK